MAGSGEHRLFEGKKKKGTVEGTFACVFQQLGHYGDDGGLQEAEK